MAGRYFSKPYRKLRPRTGPPCAILCISNRRGENAYFPRARCWCTCVMWWEKSAPVGLNHSNWSARARERERESGIAAASLSGLIVRARNQKYSSYIVGDKRARAPLFSVPRPYIYIYLRRTSLRFPFRVRAHVCARQRIVSGAIGLGNYFGTQNRRLPFSMTAALSIN